MVVPPTKFRYSYNIQNVHCNINLNRVNVAPYLLTKKWMKKSDGLKTTSQVIQFFCEVSITKEYKFAGSEIKVDNMLVFLEEWTKEFD